MKKEIGKCVSMCRNKSIHFLLLMSVNMSKFRRTSEQWESYWHTGMCDFWKTTAGSQSRSKSKKPRLSQYKQDPPCCPGLICHFYTGWKEMQHQLFVVTAQWPSFLLFSPTLTQAERSCSRLAALLGFPVAGFYLKSRVSDLPTGAWM